jgi:hypothetical protein
MPGVSTMTRSKRAALQAAMTSRTARQARFGAGRGGQRAHVDRASIDGVHADAVAEQGAATLALRVGSMEMTASLSLSSWSSAEAAHQLVGQRRLAGAAGAGDAEHRHLGRPRHRSGFLRTRRR